MLGLPVARQLAKDGFDVTIMSTNPERAEATVGESLNVVYGDVTDIESLKEPIGQHEYVYLNLSAHYDPKKYESIEIDGTAYVAAVAAASGVKRIGMISGASSKGKEAGIIYLDAKVKAEKALMGSGIPYTIMRPSWFFESLPLFIRGGRAAIVGEQPLKIGWLAVSDYARQVSTAFQKNEAANKCFYCLGPEKMTMMEALTKFCARHYSQLTPRTISFTKARLISLLPGMKALRSSLGFFKYFSTNSEDVDPSEANQILGANTVTIDRWIENWRKPSS